MDKETIEYMILIVGFLFTAWNQWRIAKNESLEQAKNFARFELMIQDMRKTMKEMKDEVEKLKDGFHGHDKAIELLQEQMKVANHRIADIEAKGGDKA